MLLSGERIQAPDGVDRVVARRSCRQRIPERGSQGGFGYPDRDLAAVVAESQLCSSALMLEFRPEMREFSSMSRPGLLAMPENLIYFSPHPAGLVGECFKTEGMLRERPTELPVALVQRQIGPKQFVDRSGAGAQAARIVNVANGLVVHLKSAHQVENVFVIASP